MRSFKKIAATLLAAVAIPGAACAATLGGYYYAAQYDYREFFSAADGKPFQVVLAGNPFPGMNPRRRGAPAAAADAGRQAAAAL